MNPIPLGVYHHYKGNKYEVIGFAKHSETLEDMVIYKALYGERGTWVRPLSMWDNLIEIDGKIVKRFEYIKDDGEELLNNLDKIHTTELGAERIRKNLFLEISDVVDWCKQKVTHADQIIRKGKNWYVYQENVVITVNARSYTIITAHQKTNPDDYIMVKKLQASFTRIPFILKSFLVEDKYVNFSAPNIQAKACELFSGIIDDIQKIRIAYEFVRDKIPHSFDIEAKIITAKASDVLEYTTGICHAKANLLAALLRSQNIPAGFCFQHCTLMNDDSEGYCVHCYNAVWLDERWIKLDARGNKPGVNAQFSLDEPVLAFPPRPEYDEYFWPGIYAAPHIETMVMLEQADSLEYIIKNIPDEIKLPPDVEE